MAVAVLVEQADDRGDALDAFQQAQQGQVAVQAVAVPERRGIELDALSGAHDVGLAGARERGRSAHGVQGVVDGHAGVERQDQPDRDRRGQP